MRGIASRSPSLACEITSIDVFGAAPDEALKSPNQNGSASGGIRALRRYYDALADRPVVREHIMVSYEELRASG
jgi:hypothetical protein